MPNVSKRKLISGLIISALSGAFGLLPAIVSAAHKKEQEWAFDGTRSSLGAQLRTFFGTSRGRYIYLRHIPVSKMSGGDRTLLAAQFEELFNDAPEDEYWIGNSYRVLCSFKTHEATQKSFVVTQSDSNMIVATALLHNFSGQFNGYADGKEPRERKSEAEQSLTIFYSGRVAPIAEVTEGILGLVRQKVAESVRAGKRIRIRAHIRRI